AKIRRLAWGIGREKRHPLLLAPCSDGLPHSLPASSTVSTHGQWRAHSMVPNSSGHREGLQTRGAGRSILEPLKPEGIGVVQTQEVAPMTDSSQDQAPKRAQRDDKDGDLAIVGKSITINR